MAYTTILSAGPPTDLTQNVVYALPARAGRIQSTRALEISPDNSTWDALTNSDTVGADVASGFVRCTGGNATVVLRYY